MRAADERDRLMDQKAEAEELKGQRLLRPDRNESAQTVDDVDDDDSASSGLCRYYPSSSAPASEASSFRGAPPVFPLPPPSRQNRRHHQARPMIPHRALVSYYKRFVSTYSLFLSVS